MAEGKNRGHGICPFTLEISRSCCMSRSGNKICPFTLETCNFNRTGHYFKAEPPSGTKKVGKAGFDNYGYALSREILTIQG